MRITILRINRKSLTAALTLLSVGLLLLLSNQNPTADVADDGSAIASIRNLLERVLSKSLGGGVCEWTPPEKLNETAIVDTTILASYPGSGKRLTWRLIEGLTGDVSGDDWDLSEEGYHVATVKTSYPHPEGNWTWGKDWPAHQSIILLRNPRWALPSYHTMRHELNYSDTWNESFIRKPNTYTERPDVEEWEQWRDARFDTEMDRWGWLLEFWMLNGRRRGNGLAKGWVNKPDKDNSDAFYDTWCGAHIPDCRPVRVLSFENFEDSTAGLAETVKLASAFVNLEGVEVIEEIAWNCVYRETMKKAETEPRWVNSNRNGFGGGKDEKRFTFRQLNIMRAEINRLRTNFADSTYLSDNNINNNYGQVTDLLVILDKYYADITDEYYYEGNLAGWQL